MDLELSNVTASVAELERELGSGDGSHRTRTPQPQNASCELLGVSGARKLPVCGNGICEFGELPGTPNAGFTNLLECAQDCPYRFEQCRETSTSPQGQRGYCSGNGRCLFASGGVCDCFAGYVGDACDTCASGFKLVDGACIPRTGELLVGGQRSGETRQLEAGSSAG